MSETNGHAKRTRQPPSYSHANGRDVFTTGHISRLCGVAPRTVSAWCNSGDLPCARIGAAGGDGDRRVAREDLIAFLRGRSFLRALKAIGGYEDPVVELVLVVGLEEWLTHAVKASLPLCTATAGLFDAGAFCSLHKPSCAIIDERMGTVAVKAAAERLQAWGCRVVVLLADEFDETTWPCPTVRSATVATVVAAAKGEDHATPH